MIPMYDLVPIPITSLARRVHRDACLSNTTLKNRRKWSYDLKSFLNPSGILKHAQFKRVDSKVAFPKDPILASCVATSSEHAKRAVRPPFKAHNFGKQIWTKMYTHSHYKR